MLTKDLIACRRLRRKLCPDFVDTTDAELLALAGRLLDIMRNGNGRTQAELEEEMEPLQADGLATVRGRGLLKVLLDRCTFMAPAERPYAADRQQLFEKAAALLRQPWPDEAAYGAAVRAAADADGNPLAGAAGGIYADLPENNRLLACDLQSPRELLERYNLALVQALLLGAQSLRITLPPTDPAKLRRLFKYLRFFRLLCRVAGETAPGPVGESAISLEIDGPASILAQARSYGLQLAIFFPALCTLPRWQLEASVSWREQVQTLALDQGSGLVCPYHLFSAYTPDEVKLFRQQMETGAGEWELLDGGEILRGANGELIIPDFTFRHPDGAIRHLELFHRYHARALLPRLRWLAETGSPPPLLLGIDRLLLRDPDIEACLANAPAELNRRLFLFRNYPTRDKTLKCLSESLS